MQLKRPLQDCGSVKVEVLGSEGSLGFNHALMSSVLGRSGRCLEPKTIA